MKRLLSLALFLLVAQTAFAQSFASSYKIGTGMPGGVGGWRTDSLDAAAATRRMVYGFQARESCTLDQICITVSSKSGTLGSSDGVLAIYSSSAGNPNSSLSSATFDPNTPGIICLTVSQAVTAGTQYWFDITNANGSPGTNYFDIPSGPANAVPGSSYGGISGDVGLGAVAKKSTDNGASWSAGAGQRAAAAVYRVHCSSGNYYGFPATTGEGPTNPIATADRVYAAREVGNRFQLPVDATVKVRCIEMDIGKIGTPTGNPYFRLYNGTTHMADTATLASTSSLINSQILSLCFSSSQTLSPSTTYRVAMAESTQSDASSDALGPHRVDWHNDGNSLPLKPFNGSIQKSICTSSCNGGTWTDTTTSYYLMNLVLDDAAPFVSSGGGGGGSYSRGIGGNLQ